MHQVFPPKDTKIEKILQNELEKKEIGFILDLRSNPGGLLDQAVKVTDIFLNISQR